VFVCLATAVSAYDLRIQSENRFEYFDKKAYLFKNSSVDESSKYAGVGFDFPKSIWKISRKILTIDGSDLVFFSESGKYLSKVPVKDIPRNGELGSILYANANFILVAIDYFDDASDLCTFDLKGNPISYLRAHYLNNIIPEIVNTPEIRVVLDDGFYVIDAKTGIVSKSEAFVQHVDRIDRSRWIKLSPVASLNITSDGVSILKAIVSPEGWSTFDRSSPLASISMAELTHNDPVYEKYLGRFMKTAHFYDQSTKTLYVSIAIPYMPGTNNLPSYRLLCIDVVE